ncbi:hypothetical protein LIN78_17635 [Leeia sp. TBRC 13508]|uniref:Uncharacterized protein n=1 Tax=Leeia speluncae TaxID=2884804 RepID=A0ABS8DB70_9NEIS|nr:hypothetical protein [Leeia speluncae]MCB6185372.1 hypothetical protein [Leeia speluncae]
MSRIAIDMDEVLADTQAKQLAWLNQQFDLQLTPKKVEGHLLWEALSDEAAKALDNEMRQPDFFADLAVMPHAKSIMEILYQEHEIFIATAAMEYPTSFTAKFDWLAMHFPYIHPSRIVFCGDKSIIHADYLIDDSPRFLSGFKGQGLLYRAPRNVNVTDYPVVENWLDVAKYFSVSLPA